MRNFVLAGLTSIVITILSLKAYSEEGSPVKLLKSPSIGASSLNGKARLNLVALLEISGTYRIECEFKCESDAGFVYNAYLQNRRISPAQVFITSADGKIRLELLDKVSTFGKATVDDWTFLRSGNSVGREFIVEIRSDGDVEIKRSPACVMITIPPGTYYFHAEYSHWLVALWPNRPGVKRTDSAVEFSDEPVPIGGRTLREMDEPFAVSQRISIVIE